jgi:hypothetical protein
MVFERAVFDRRQARAMFTAEMWLQVVVAGHVQRSVRTNTRYVSPLVESTR